MDLVVCVGESCHLNGSEEVVRCFQRLLAAAELTRAVTLKGSFCIGECTGTEGVSIRLGEDVYHTRYQDAQACFEDRIRPRIDTLLAGE